MCTHFQMDFTKDFETILKCVIFSISKKKRSEWSCQKSNCFSKNTLTKLRLYWDFSNCIHFKSQRVTELHYIHFHSHVLNFYQNHNFFFPILIVSVLKKCLNNHWSQFNLVSFNTFLTLEVTFFTKEKHFPSLKTIPISWPNPS